MRTLGAIAVLLAAPALAEQNDNAPRFVDARSALPSEHVYAGDWEHFVGGGVAVFDCNGDMRPDIFAAGGTNPAALFVSRSGPDIAFDTGLGVPPLTGVTGAYPLDIDGDGNVDLAIMRVGQNRLLRGHGNCRFTDAGAEWGFDGGDGWSTAFSATWETENEWPTLAVGNYVNRADPDGPFEACDTNRLYRPSDRSFGPPVELAPGFCALSMLFSDWQRTGSPELRISNDRHYYVRGGYEQMWRLSPLEERSSGDGWNRVSIWGMGIASADLQYDGYPDVMLTSMGDQVLFLNDLGTLAQADYSSGTTAQRPHIGDDGRPSTGWHAEFGDIDNDGLQDLFIAKGNVDQMPSNAIADPNNLLMQSEPGLFHEASVEAGIATTDRSRGAALADFDLDGRLDLVVVNRRAPMELWLNNSEHTGNWASVDLRMDGPNAFAIGAWLEIKRRDGTERRERTVGGGHVSGTLLPFHIGLGNAPSVLVRAVWPAGDTSEWVKLGAGRRMVIRR